LIETFLNKRLLTVPSTRKCYRVNIQSYFRLSERDMTHYFNNGTTTEDYEEDLRRVYKILHDGGKPDLSIRTFFNAVKQFMINHDKKLKDLDFWETLRARTRGAEPESDEAILNKDSIKEILSHGNACSRAMFLILASSGRRIGEVLALTPDDINISTSPATINIRKTVDRKTTKTKQKTLCFISDEARESYISWMKERDEYLRIAVTRGNHEKDPNDKRVFPMSYHNALIIWNNLLMKADIVEIEKYTDKWTGKQNRRIKKDKKGERTLQHPHCLRKFFRSYLGDADLGEYLMGHGTMLTRAYRQMTPEDLGQRYQKLMPNVTIFGHAPDLTGINESLKEKDDEIQKLKQEMHELRNHVASFQIPKEDEDTFRLIAEKMIHDELMKTKNKK